MTAPDRIWLCRHQFMGCVHEVDFHEDPDGTPYIRSDLHAALQAENERLREALESIRDTMDITAAEGIARAALK